MRPKEQFTGHWLTFAGCIGFWLLVVTMMVLTPSTVPPLGSPGDQLIAYYVAHRTAFLAASFLDILECLASLLFFSGVWSVLRRVEGEGGPLTTFALGSGIVSVTMLSIAWALNVPSVHLATHGLAPEVIAALHATKSALDALSCLPRALFIAATALVMLRTAALPRWIGWVGLAAGLSYLVSTAGYVFSTGENPLDMLEFIAFVLFVTWMMATSTVLVRHARFAVQVQAVPA